MSLKKQRGKYNIQCLLLIKQSLSVLYFIICAGLHIIQNKCSIVYPKITTHSFEPFMVYVYIQMLQFIYFYQKASTDAYLSDNNSFIHESGLKFNSIFILISSNSNVIVLSKFRLYKTVKAMITITNYHQKHFNKKFTYFHHLVIKVAW